MRHPKIIEACNAAGLDPASPVATLTRWTPDTQPELDIVYLAAGPDTNTLTIVPMSVKNRKTGVFRSKLASDTDAQADDGTTDAVHTETTRINSLKNGTFLVDLQTQFPAVDFSPLKYSVAAGKLVVDVSGLTANQQSGAKTRVAASNYADKVVIVP